jgi:signal transduction histidine kinase
VQGEGPGWVVRYGLAAGVFASLIGVTRGVHALTGANFDTTSLIILWMIACAWYLGRGPGLVVAVLFESLIDYYAAGPYNTLRFWLTVFNRTLLFGSVVLFASARRNAERSLTTQARALEATLARERTARDDAERANRLKDDFLATISHELRTPLNAVLGWASLLSKRDADADTAKRAAAAIARCASAQAQLVDDILDTSRIVSGGLRIERQRVPLAGAVSDAVDTMQVAASAKQLVVESTLDSDVVVIGDASRLRQIAYNLISNAIKFTPDGGCIAIAVRQASGAAELQVRDTGIGIEPSFAPHVFDRFRQADASMTREQGGLGLGLAITRHLVELHGGTIALESAGRGFGSCFTVRLPLTPAETVSPARAMSRA